ncbi:antibiotic biosynthesis monooxygenase [Yinghuangia sp. ASG 101]|uniref:SchA/CurD-like domain-containing protein n=1 Tax=Yinghuangia sp. ASG 101 TaxID=2896848 RepID=UPI001E2D3DD6|nr:SchA/CurD-like domain-containing protein [Yinghuangia sp. ASG 101]UGQ10793.1 antibiotic biosynthesis monooxygenase [Yinghuangia sp. ASG 101]
MDTTVQRHADRAKEPKAPADESKLRVLLMLEIHEGSQQRFLDAYESIRDQVAQVPGHLRDQLCQSIEDPTQWLITSEWADADQFLEWVDSPEHQLMVRPLHGCVRGTRSLRYAVARETGPEHPVTAPGASAAARAPRAPRAAADVTRCALSFTVKPGSEEEVARILSGYDSPEPRVDATTTLRRTTVFMRDNVIVRAIEIQGDMRAALQHVARQPQVRAAEEALNAYLEEARNLDDPQAAREFFMRSSLAEDFRMAAARPRPGDDEADRAAFLYPVAHGSADAVARLLARHDEAALADPDGPLAASSVYVRQDLLVRVVDLRAGAEAHPAVMLGVAPADAERFARLLDRPVGDLTDEGALRRLLAGCAMTPVTDRRAAVA